MRRQWNKQQWHKKVDDRGMSLVEVIIAVTILGIIAVPVLHALTTSMTYNAKARARQKLTLTAETIMETFNGYDIKSVHQMFETGSGVAGITCAGYTAPDLTLVEDHTSQLDFGIDGLDVGAGKLYNVDITVNPGVTKDVFEMKNMDTARDAIFVSTRDYDKNAVKNAAEDFSSAANKAALKDFFITLKDETTGDAIDALNADNVLIKDNVDIIYTGDGTNGSITDYIEIHDRRLRFVTMDDGDGNYVVTAQMIYSYSIENYPYYMAVYPPPVPDEYPGASGGTEPPSSSNSNQRPFVGALAHIDHYPKGEGDVDEYLYYTVDLVVPPISYDQAADYTDDNKIYKIYENPQAAKLNRLFVYYYPQYDVGIGKDIIEIKNDAGIPDFQCYIIKQVAEDISMNRIKIEENHYSATVELVNSALGFKIFHNFNENIGGGSSHTAPSMPSTCTESGYIDPAMFAQKEVLSYQVKIVVTNAVGGGIVTELESTVNEKIKTSEGVVD